MSSSMVEKRVLVTGGNGFIGTHLVRLLLERSYDVHATHHPSEDPTHLLSLPGSHRHLRLFPTDLLDAPAISAAAKGCCAGVFHVASPCTLEDPRDPLGEVVAPAVRGTEYVLEAARACGARRVVVTSSISAMVPNPGWGSGRVVDEECWTDVEYCKQRMKWYPVSKTLAEKVAWEYAEKHGMDIVVINPSTCLGPLLQPGLNASSAVLQQLLQGSKDTQEYHWLGCVHVRDVAAAHILLLETHCASGRHLCTNGIYQFKDFAQTVAKLCPSYNVHRFTEETQPGLVACKDAAKKLIDLGLVFTPIEEAIKESESSLKAHGFLSQPKRLEENSIVGANDRKKVAKWVTQEHAESMMGLNWWFLFDVGGNRKVLLFGIESYATPERKAKYAVVSEFIFSSHPLHPFLLLISKESDLSLMLVKDR